MWVTSQETAVSYLITPGQQQDLHAGVFSRRGDFDDDGLHHDCPVREVLDGVTLQHAKTNQEQRCQASYQ